MGEGFCPAGAVAEMLRADLPKDAYRLEMDRAGIRITAGSDTGRFYAGQTLRQLRRIYPDALPAMTIEDEPVFPVRGFMLDISRNKVPKMETLFRLVDRLAEWKFNQLQLYTEHTFAYRNHRDVWKGSSPMTGAEVERLDRYCRERHIDLVPNQNSFGHLARWMKTPRLRHLAEAPDGFTTPWGETRRTPFSLNPVDPASLELLDGLYRELLPHFSSALFHVGCDETFDLGQGRSRVACEARGKGRVYLEFLQRIHGLVTSRERRMIIWGDIVLNHPELIPELPEDVICCVWGYEHDHPFDRDCAAMQNAGRPFYVCPGTSTWNAVTGRLTNARENIRNAAAAGMARGAEGYLLTEWGDNGHWQTLPFSLAAIALGAGAAWGGEDGLSADPAKALTLHGLGGESPDIACAVIGLADVDPAAGHSIFNASVAGRLLLMRNPRPLIDDLPPEAMDRLRRAILDAVPSSVTKDKGEGRTLAEREVLLAYRMLLHACDRGDWWREGKPEKNAGALHRDVEDIIGEFRACWLARNRSGGLAESLVPLRRRLREYRRG